MVDVHRRMEWTIIRMVQPIMNAVSAAFNDPTNALPGWAASGRKFCQMLCQPAVSVVIATNTIGASVTQA